jgi:hypothetical protein
MGSSFISEHSAEFALVPQFTRILNQEFSNVIPLFFWSRREGGNMASVSLKGSLVKIVALYPRRPKVEKVNQSFIEIKINESLFRTTDFLSAHGIPVFAGIPVISSLEMFDGNATCAWFKLLPNGTEEILLLSLENKLLTEPGNAIMINDKNILSIIETECKELVWEEAVTYLKKAKNYGEEYQRSFFGSRYKPVYFVIPILLN